MNEFGLAEIANGEIVGRIPISALSDLARYALSSGGFAVDERTAETRYAVVDPNWFAIEVCAAWNNEAEDGGTPLRRSFDAAICAAVEQGATGIDEFEPEDGCPRGTGGE